MKKKILFLLHLKNSMHGAGIVNNNIIKIKNLKKKYKISYIDISTTQKLEEINIFKISKIILFFKIYIHLFYKLLIYRPNYVYISMSIIGYGFYKDSLIVLLCKLFRIKIIFHLHRKGIQSIIRNSYLKLVYYRFIFRKSKIIHLSKLLFNDLNNLLINDEDKFFLHNGIKTYRQSKNKSKFLNAVFLSNLFKSKGIYELLKSFKILNKQGYKKKIFLNIVGDCTAEIQLKDIKDYINKNGLNQNVKYFGKKNTLQKYNILNKCNFMVFPTKDDCFPLCILEGMSCGLAILSTRQGAIPEMVINNYNGFLIKKSDPKLISNKIKRYIQNKKKLKEHSINSKIRFYKNFTIKHFENNLFNILTKII